MEEDMTADIKLTPPTTKGFLTKVVVEDGQTVMLFSDELLKALALRPNEVLEWSVNDRDKTITIRRHHIIDNVKA
jgi:hypothetical protein